MKDQGKEGANKKDTTERLLQQQFAGRIKDKAIKSDTNWFVWVEGIKDPELISEIKYFAATHQVGFENYKGILSIGKLAHEL